MYLINFLRKNLFSSFFFLISLKLTKIKLTSSALSFSLSLFARFSIPERKHERRQLVKFFPLLFWPNWMRNSPVTQSDRPPPPPPPFLLPLPWICTLFSRTYVSPRNSSSTPHSDTRLYSVCEYKIEVIRKEPPESNHEANPARIWQARSLSRNVDIRIDVFSANVTLHSRLLSLVPVTHVFFYFHYFRIFVSEPRNNTIID